MRPLKQWVQEKIERKFSRMTRWYAPMAAEWMTSVCIVKQESKSLLWISFMVNRDLYKTTKPVCVCHPSQRNKLNDCTDFTHKKELEPKRKSLYPLAIEYWLLSATIFCIKKLTWLHGLTYCLSPSFILILNDNLVLRVSLLILQDLDLSRYGCTIGS